MDISSADSTVNTVESSRAASSGPFDTCVVYVFTNVIEEGPTAADECDRLRSVARRRGSLFLAVMLTCDIEAQVSRIDNPDRVALRKGSDPEATRGHRLTTNLYQPPEAEVIHLDSTETPPAENAKRIYHTLRDRGFARAAG